MTKHKEILEEFEYDIMQHLNNTISREDRVRIQKLKDWTEQLIYGDKDQIDFLKRVGSIEEMIKNGDIEDVIDRLEDFKEKLKLRADEIDDEIGELESELEYNDREIDEIDNLIIDIRDREENMDEDDEY